MIHEDLGLAIKEILGKNYTKKILDYLDESQINKPSGKPYIAQEVYYTVNGIREYEELESAIIDFVEKYKADLELESRRRERLLK